MKRQAQVREYSKLFTTIYDADAPGVTQKFSILRALVDGPREHFVCVYWDADHDVRVIEILEDLYLARRLQDFVGIRESRAHVSLYTTYEGTRGVAGSVEMSDGDYFHITSLHVPQTVGHFWKLGTHYIEPRVVPSRDFPGMDRDALKAKAVALGLCKLENRFGTEKLKELLRNHANIPLSANAEVYK